MAQINKEFNSIKDINTDTTEGKLLIAALAMLTTTEENSHKEPDKVLLEVLERAYKIFAYEAM